MVDSIEDDVFFTDSCADSFVNLESELFDSKMEVNDTSNNLFQHYDRPDANLKDNEKKISNLSSSFTDTLCSYSFSDEKSDLLISCSLDEDCAIFDDSSDRNLLVSAQPGRNQTTISVEMNKKEEITENIDKKTSSHGYELFEGYSSGVCSSLEMKKKNLSENGLVKDNQPSIDLDQLNYGSSYGAQNDFFTGFKTGSNKPVKVQERTIQSVLEKAQIEDGMLGQSAFFVSEEDARDNLRKNILISKESTLCDRKVRKKCILAEVDINSKRMKYQQQGFRRVDPLEAVISDMTSQKSCSELNVGMPQTTMNSLSKNTVGNRSHAYNGEKSFKSEFEVHALLHGRESAVSEVIGVQDNKSQASIPTDMSHEIPRHYSANHNYPQNGCIYSEIAKEASMKIIFTNICKIYKNESKEWVLNHFKWCWMHFVLNPVQNEPNYSLLWNEKLKGHNVNGDLSKAPECSKVKETHLNSARYEPSNLIPPENSLEYGIQVLMRYRYMNERSVLKNIVEFDDIAYRFMVLGILEIHREHIVVYDGYYSLKVKIDQFIFELLKDKHMGQKIYVFGSELLIDKPMGILEAKDQVVLGLNYNGVRLCHENGTKLGYRKKVSFLNKIRNVRIDGSTVSCLIFTVDKIIEDQYLVRVGNYSKQVKDVELEIENIYAMASDRTTPIKPEDFTIRRYLKVSISDDSGECLLTWWDHPEHVKCGECYKMIYLTPIRSHKGLHLTTSKKTYFEIVK